MKMDFESIRPVGGATIGFKWEQLDSDNWSCTAAGEYRGTVTKNEHRGDNQFEVWVHSVDGTFYSCLILGLDTAKDTVERVIDSHRVRGSNQDERKIDRQ